MVPRQLQCAIESFYIAILKTDYNTHSPEFKVRTHQAVDHLLSYLRVAGNSGGVHATGHVHRIAPNVILWLSSSNYARHNGSNVDA